jgi:uroporphyrinogen decarboxylase
MGCGLYFVEGEGPQFEKPIRTLEDINNLHWPDEESLGYVFKAIEFTTNELNGKIPLIGFCGSPWTVATYMVEGGASKNFSMIKQMMYQNPEHLHLLLDKLTQASIAYLKNQILAGAQAVMIFDTWGGLLSTPCYHDFSLAYMQKIVSALESKVPLILFTKNGGQWLESMACTGATALGLDWTISLKEAKDRVGSKVVLQGNCDPAILFASPHKIREEVAKTLDSFGQGGGHIFNLGHGLLPNLDPHHVEAFIQAVIELSPAYYT